MKKTLLITFVLLLIQVNSLQLNFSSDLRAAISADRQSQLNYFENIQYGPEEDYVFNGNSEYAVINLKQSDFDSGTVRITKPGYYRLTQNIEFNPNSNANYYPTPAQIASGQYAVSSDSPYTFGFFAAITLESDHIVIDLNGKKLEQSFMHNLRQRFYANIQVASAPFRPDSTGLFSNNSNFVTSKYVVIMNGKLGRCAHHGIHGNNLEQFIFTDLKITQFGVAGIALNGSSKGIIHDVIIRDNDQQTLIDSKFSHANNLFGFLYKFKAFEAANPNFPPITLNLQNRSIGITQALVEMQQEFVAAIQSVLAGQSPQGFFNNPNPGEGIDANVYGLVLNQEGVVSFDFAKEQFCIENDYIIISDVKIKNLLSRVHEAIQISADRGLNYLQIHPNQGQVGPTGDAFQINMVKDENGLYKENVVANTQLLITKYSKALGSTLGLLNIHPDIIQWAEQGTESIDAVMSREGYMYVYGQDVQMHHLKGNLGLFISCGNNIEVNNLIVNGITNTGDVTPHYITGKKQGADSFGVVVTGSGNVSFNDYKVKNILSAYGEQGEVKIIDSYIRQN